MLKVGLIERFRKWRERRFESESLFQTLPSGVTEEQAITIVASTSWAQGIAKKIAEMGELKPGTPEYNEFVKTFSRNIARRMLRL